jgi:glycosyltransferase involved in cell wall biosynthesis
MRIAHYYPWVYLTSGIERVIVELCTRSRHQHAVLTNHFEPENTYAGVRSLEVIQLPFVSVERSLRAVLKAAVTIATMQVSLERFDVLVVHCDGLGDLVLNRRRELPVVCMCHTPLRPVYDVHYAERAIARYGGVGRLGFRLFAAGFRWLDRKMWARYRYGFFMSEEVRRRAEEGGLLQRLNGRHEVLHPGVDWHGIEPTWRHEPYFLVAGRIMWTKNIELAIEAYTRFRNTCLASARFRLVIAGAVDAKSRAYLSRLRSMANGRRDIEFVVSPSDESLRSLYASCYAALFPPFNEDWGMVPIEANAYGKPVVAVNRGGPLESQVHGETGYLVRGEPEAFADAMARLAGDDRLVRTMGRRARDHALKYDWSHFVSRTDEVLGSLGGGHDREARDRFAVVGNSRGS